MADDRMTHDEDVPDGAAPPPAPSVMGGARQQWQVHVPYASSTMTLGLTPTAGEGASLTTTGNVLVDCTLSMMTQSTAGMMHQTNGPWILIADAGINTATPGNVEMLAGGSISVYSGREQGAGDCGEGVPAQSGAPQADPMDKTEDEVAHKLIPLGAVRAATDLHIGALIFKAKWKSLKEATGVGGNVKGVYGLLAPMAMMTGGLKQLAEVTSAAAHGASQDAEKDGAKVAKAFDRAAEDLHGKAYEPHELEGVTSEEGRAAAKKDIQERAKRVKSMAERLAPAAQKAADTLDHAKDWMKPMKIPNLLAKGHEPSPNPFEPWPVNGAMFLLKAKDGIKLVTPKDMIAVAKKNMIHHAAGKMQFRAWKHIEMYSRSWFALALDTAEVRSMIDLFITCYGSTEIRGRSQVLVESNKEVKVKGEEKIAIKSPTIEIKSEKAYKLVGKDVWVEADSATYQARHVDAALKTTTVEIGEKLKLKGGNFVVASPMAVDAKSIFTEEVDIRANLSVRASEIHLNGSRVLIG